MTIVLLMCVTDVVLQTLMCTDTLCRSYLRT